MLLWGAIWGGVLGLLWPGHGWEFQALAGAMLGALAGKMLRNAVVKELAIRLAAPPVPASVAPPASAASPANVQARALPVEPVEAPAAAAATVALADSTVSSPALESVPLPAPEPVPLPQPHPGLLTNAMSAAKAWLFGGNTVVRMGVLVLFVGLAFLAKYAVDNALLPPELRLAAIGAAGIGLFVAGNLLRRRGQARLAYALTLQGAGIAVLYLTVFAAFRLYQFLPAGAAFGALALICAFAAVIAVAQNAVVMAFIGFAGGFAAPLLVTTGQGNHVALFGYYLLLGIAIATLAWVKAWRSLNLLGFFATFGVATVWGVLKYRPEDFASTEPFLIAFFGVYLIASLLYATRHSLAAKQAVDATLIFGTPLVAFVLQAGLVKEMEFGAAFSALALGAVYLGLGAWMAPRGSRSEVHRWLGECFAALGLGFVTLAVPLALEARWTATIWAIEGAAVFWMGRRQERWLARATGVALQLLAALAFLESQSRSAPSPWPLINPGFIGAAMLAVAAAAIASWSREPAGPRDTTLQRAYSGFEHRMSPVMFWVAFLWWQFALHSEIVRSVATLDASVKVFDAGARIHLHLLAWVASAYAVHRLALPGRLRPWPIAATPAWTVLPAMFAAALVGMADLGHVFQSGGWAVWPLAVMLHLVMLRRLDAGPPQPWWHAVHAAGVWLLVLLGGNLLVFTIGRADLWQTAWATVILLVSGIAVLLALCHRGWYDADRAGGRWPLDRFGRDYLWVAAAPLALAIAVGSLFVAIYSDGNARPLPYVPLLNPTDLSVALGLAACAVWLMRIRASALAVPDGAADRRWLLALAAIGFIAVNTVWLRVAHHYAGVPWDSGRLFSSFLVQAGYSILWSLIALGLMIGAHRRASRGAWMGGAGLLGLTVVKLFVIDLSNRGGSERIFVFIAVGVLMLVVGYFAPMPPVKRPEVDLLKAAQ